MPLKNFGIVVPGRFYRNAQPDEHGFKVLEELGVDMIHQLNGDSDSQYWHRMLRSRNMATFGDFTKDVLEAVEQIQTDLDLGRVIDLHCTHGRDRTGVTAAAWQILKDGRTFEEVEEERLHYGSDVILEIADYRMVDFLHGLTAHHA
jgi:protein tyrosine/serine phosphatase